MRKILILQAAALLDPHVMEVLAQKREQLEGVAVREQTFKLQAFPMPEIECYVAEPKQQSWQERVAPAALLRKPKRSR